MNKVVTGSKEIIHRAIRFKSPERIGWDFLSPHPSDFCGVGPKNPQPGSGWGKGPELLALVPGFIGDVWKDEFGNIWGRLDGLSKGEVIRGALEDGWVRVDDYQLPDFYTAPRSYRHLYNSSNEVYQNRFVLGGLPGFPFSIMRKLRRMENFLMDTLLAKPEVLELSRRVEDMLTGMIEIYGNLGFVDGVVFAEDWGTQNALLISPESWRELFKPAFRRLAECAHRNNLLVLMHSCGYIYDIIPDLIEVGVDALQLDQPELMGVERLGKNFGGQIAFWCPVDIQKIMQSGDRKLIEESAVKMIDCFGRFGGGFIAKDYPQWDAIGVRSEWADWARQVFTDQAG